MRTASDMSRFSGEASKAKRWVVKVVAAVAEIAKLTSPGGGV